LQPRADLGGGGGPAPYFWQSQFYFLHCTQCLKQFWNWILIGFHEKSVVFFYLISLGFEIVAVNVFCSAKAQFWMISEAILIPKIYASLQEIASNFLKFSGGGQNEWNVKLNGATHFGALPLAWPLSQFLDLPLATAIYSVTMVLWKKTAFPLCRAMEKRWKKNLSIDVPCYQPYKVLALCLVSQF